jgi:hypothetical protein
MDTATPTAPTPDPAPEAQVLEFDADALKSVMTEAVSQVMAQERQAAMQEMARQREAIRQATQAPSQAQQPPDPVYQAIRPYLEPALQAATLRAEAAEDMARFYLQHPEAREFAPHLEQMFQDTLANGRPTTRETLWHLYRGAHFDYFRQRMADADAARAKQAQDAAVVGPGAGGSRGGPALTAELARTMSTDDLARALGRVTF